MAAIGALRGEGAVTPVRGVSRGQLYAAAIVLLLANAAADRAFAAIRASGAPAALLSGLGQSWAFWIAFVAAVRLAVREPAAPVRPRDAWICAAAALAALAPVSPVAAAACTALAAAILIDRDNGPLLKAAGWVLGAASVQLIWSRLLMAVFVQPIADVDAHLVGFFIRRPVHGNNVLFADGSRVMSILGACTSVQNASVALMLFVAIVRSFRPVPRPTEALALGGVFLSVVAINVARLVLMAQNAAMFHFVHGDVGAGIVNAVITLAALAWAAVCVRRELFA